MALFTVDRYTVEIAEESEKGLGQSGLTAKAPLVALLERTELEHQTLIILLFIFKARARACQSFEGFFYLKNVNVITSKV